MKILEATRKQLVLKPARREETYGERGAFIFGIGIVPDKPTPKRIVFRKRAGRYLVSWSASWAKFLRMGCVGDVAIIRKRDLSYSVAQANPSLKPTLRRKPSGKSGQRSARAA